MKWALTSSYAANWHPVTWISHMLDVQLFGLNPMGHHIVNVLLHAVTMLLLFVVLFRMTGAIGRSAAVAGLFGLHPIHVESVAWVAERKDVLSALFWVLTMWTYVAYVRQPRVSRYIWIVVTFALGLMAKPMVVTLPFALLLLDVWPLRRIDLHAGWWTAARSLLLEKAPLFALSIGSSVITFVVQRHGGTVASSVRLPLVERIGNALISYIAYIGKTLWPLHLAAYYPYPRVLPVALVVVSAVLLLAISIAAIFAGRRHPYVLIGWLWYLGTLVPAIGIVQVGTQAMADRYTYIPLIGIFIILAWGVPDILSSPRWKTPIAAVTAAMLLSCAVVARQQVHHWESSQTLWQHALSVTTDNYAAHTFYGNALATQGNVDGAVAEYNEALRIRPDYPEAHNNLGPALAQSGRVDEAIAHFLEAVRLRPNYADAHNNLGVALATQGKFDEAIAHYTEALRLDPDQSRPHSNLGLALQAQGRTAEATREFELALRMNRNDVDAQNGLKALQGQRP
jgi:Tfp pilus assembly protein PilF